MVAIAENTAENSKFAIGPVDGHWPADQYVTVRGVPVFAEHRTKTKDGRELRFGQRELQAVADRCNRRIRETGDYAVVCLGHTPDLDQKAAGVNIDPEVVGFAGPFRVDPSTLPWLGEHVFHTQQVRKHAMELDTLDNFQRFCSRKLVEQVLNCAWIDHSAPTLRMPAWERSASLQSTCTR